jgi:hypothetical protein
MTFDNRITSGIENEKTPGAPENNDVSMFADLLDDEKELVEINSEADMRGAFERLRQKAGASVSAAELRLLYREGADLIEMLDNPPFQERVGDQLDEIRRAAEEEFAETARALNRQGREINAKANYAEVWQG